MKKRLNIRPKILLAFANTSDPTRSLPKLDEERRNIENVLMDNPHCETFPMIEARLNKIESFFKKFRDDIKVFHFAGHGGGEFIELEAREEGQLKTAFAQGLAKFMGNFKGLHLVFLNACATESQIRIFHKVGIKAVIATSKPINDSVACDFASLFYENLHQGSTIQEAFEYATTQLKSRHKVKDYYKRSLEFEEMLEEDLDPRHPYLLRLSADAPEAAQATLSSWAEEMQATYWEEEAGEQEAVLPEAKPIGKLSYLLVDRYKENMTFEDVLKARINQAKKRPQAFIIHGKEEERPQSLSRRFKEFTVRHLLEHKVDALIRDDRDIQLPRKEDFQHRDAHKGWLRLMDALQTSFHLKNYSRELKAQILMQRISQSTHVTFLEHRIYSANWHPGMKALLQKYIHDFWDIQLQAHSPFVILIFNVVYPNKSKGFSFKTKPEKQAEEAMNDIACDECIMINKLNRVPIEDLQEWRDRYLPLEAYLDDQIYQSKKLLPMQLIEKELQSAIERHNSRTI